MIESLLYLLLILLLINIALLALLLRKTSGNPMAAADVRFDVFERNQERTERLLLDEIAKNREESKEARQELNDSFRAFNESMLRRLSESASSQKDQLEIFSGQLKALTDQNIQKLDRINDTVEKKLSAIQEDSNKKLEQMRATVDEKLHDTLEKRLGESFRIVSERLELVHKGLGEMQSLAVGVG
ncbi:MAG TPA: DNA recombination protein RmuC, partial [Geobacteraceae bacterium]|nr:DNA recombination protein RmuC [Geobacteraceae bacterium]